MTRILKDDWEFNVLGVYNYNKPGKLDPYYDYIRANHDRIPGDIAEAGVFRGRSLLATALLLKELGSDKRVFGYDSFAGFSGTYHELDQLEQFDRLRAEGRISEEYWQATQKLREYRSFLKKAPVTVETISSSTDFSDTSKGELERKLEFLGLDNVVLVDGLFEQTMVPSNPAQPDGIMALLLDCDLYQGYVQTLGYAWPRLSQGGLIYLDEYYSLKFPGARIATDDFFRDKADKPQEVLPRQAGDFERWVVRKTEARSA